MKIKTVLVTIAALLAVSSAAQAAQIIGSGTGISSPTVTLDFSEVVLSDSTSLTNQYAAYGVEFSGLFYNACSNCVAIPAKPDLGNFSSSNTSAFGSGFDIYFSSAVTGASFQFASNGGSFNFQAFSGASVVDSFTADGSVWGNYGFEGVSFDRIHVDTPSAMLIDNLQIAAVPEPSTYAMLLAGLGMLGFTARRRQA